MAATPDPVTPEVIYESTHVGVGHRLAVAVGSGVVVFAAMAFLRWGCGAAAVDRRGLLGGALVGGALAVGLVVAALRSRVVWRVTLDRAAGELRIERDPAVVERWPLADVAGVRTLPVAGGWSRDPSERLAVQVRGEPGERVFALPDDALTEGIARDIRAALSALEAREDVAEDPTRGVAGSREVGEQGVEGASLGAVAVAQTTGDRDGRRG